MGTVEKTDDSGRVSRNPFNSPIQYIATKYGGEKPKELERFLKFAVVGVSGAIVDFGIVFLLQETVLPPTSPLNVAVATGIAFICAVLSNFIWTRLWVYPDSRTKSLRRQLAIFSFISITGGVARTIWIASTYAVIGYAVMPVVLPLIQSINSQYVPSPVAEERLGTVVAQLIAMVVVMLWNFFANRYWTYNDVD